MLFGDGGHNLMNMKICSCCKQEKENVEFWKSNRSPDGLQYQCKDCQKAKNKHYKKTNEIHIKSQRRKNLLKSYGLNTKTYDIIILEQGGLCRICKDSPTKHGKTDRLFVDYDHKAEKVRGLLCHHCNNGLKNFKGNSKFLEEAIKYLKEIK